MRSLNKYFENRKIDYHKLIEYGFVKNDSYIYKTKIYDFEIVIEINDNIKQSKIIDTETNEEYILVDIENANGEYVGKIKSAYDDIIKDIVDKCSSLNIFKSDYAKDVIKYIKDKYNDDLEYLWEKFSNNAIWRNKKNNKWYGLLVNISKSKIGLESNEIVDIIDLRYQKDDIEKIIDNKTIFKGYHMNKKSWITIILDGSVDINRIYELIDNSYNLSLNK